MTLLYLVAGEASGDVLGGRLMAALRARRPDLAFAGIGGSRMAEQGLVSLFPMEELSLMGLAEVLPRLRGLARRLAEAEADVLARRPAALVTIDAPSFTLRLAARVRPKGVRVIHYVAPQVWAWRQGRVRRIARRIDRLLALLPFEPPFFEAAGIPTSFVGHPVLESGADRGNAARFRTTHGIAPETRLLAVMPGSRGGELARHLPVFARAAALLRDRLGTLALAVPTLPRLAEAVRAAPWPVAPIVTADETGKHDAWAAAAAALAKSGTTSLELAVAGVPQVVAYRVNPITAAIVRRLVTVPHASLVNLLAGEEVVPERLQEQCTPERLAAALLPLLTATDAAAAQRAAFVRVLGQLRPPGGLAPSEAAAEAVLAELAAVQR
ncbi:lipid-A-disaccharide synthase [Elioraea sp.]|uniref:lipid-A-disaccharide synthase n=1 Tax=Elioraea sp. TaxID=2185103 RepID=UPI0021DDCB4A|nr:lipid-A-disaccharide synthase [Elioraea sp.]GIX09757.1 MAG: lipid-A-disaccharide synthase [Elioraea sp.]